MRLAVIFALVLEVTVAKATYNLDHVYHGPPAPLSKDGKVIDTPEVAHAKAAHFAAYHHIASKVASEPDEWTDAYQDKDELGYGLASNEIEHGHHEHHEDHHEHEHHEHVDHHHHVPAYHGPPAPLGHDGRVVDTDEVAKAKAAHLAALEHAKALAAKSGDHHHLHHHHEHQESALVKSFYHVPFSYHGPAAPLAHDGRVIDTPEVAKARNAHLHAFAHEKTLIHYP